MNTSVSFPIAKLLKEKGFERNVGYSKPYYNHLGELNGDVTEYIRAQIHDEDTTPFETTPVPTIAEVVMWLYEKHNLWISVVPYNDEELSQTLWENKTIDIADDYNDCSDYTFYHSPTEAYEAAILYTLNNLI